MQPHDLNDPRIPSWEKTESKEEQDRIKQLEEKLMQLTKKIEKLKNEQYFINWGSQEVKEDTQCAFDRLPARDERGNYIVYGLVCYCRKCRATC